MKGKTAIGCSDYKVCGFKIPFEIFGKKLSEKQIQDLITKKKTSKLKGFPTHPEGIEEGVLILGADFEVDLQK
jgi:DNA topoisomerase-3